MQLIRKIIICDNDKCGQGNQIAPKGRATATFSGITPQDAIDRHLKLAGWRIFIPENGTPIHYCPSCHKRKKK